MSICKGFSNISASALVPIVWHQVIFGLAVEIELVEYAILALYILEPLLLFLN